LSPARGRVSATRRGPTEAGAFYPGQDKRGLATGRTSGPGNKHRLVPLQSRCPLSALRVQFNLSFHVGLGVTLRVHPPISSPMARINPQADARNYTLHVDSRASIGRVQHRQPAPEEARWGSWRLGPARPGGASPDRRCLALPAPAADHASLRCVMAETSDSSRASESRARHAQQEPEPRRRLRA
jgi:hypothetical protein